MYSVLLADDEPIIIKGLKKMIRWEALNCTIIGEAFDGADAVEKVRKFKPDILVTDISMPHKTGIEIIKILKEEELDTRVIFLSAYREFSYAKEAVKYGAVDYLLKPLDQQELEKTILKAEHMLKREHHIEIPEVSRENKIQDAFQSLNAADKNIELYKQFRDMEINVVNNKFVGACFSVLPPAEGEEGLYELLKFSIFKRIQKHLKIKRIGFSIKPDDSMCNLLLVLPQKETDVFIQEMIAETIDMVKAEYNVDVIVGIGDQITDLNELKYAYRTAKFAAELHYFEILPIIYYQEIDKKYTKSIDDYNEEYQALLDAVLTHKEDYSNHLKIIINLIKDIHYGNKYAVINRCVQFCMDLFKDLLEYRLVNESYRSDYENFIDVLRKQTSFDRLRRQFIKFFLVFIKNIIENPNTKELTTIIQVKEYIKANYGSDISLKQIAKVAYMNPYYFSSFFKKVTGQNFKQYLTEIRMKEAIKLLMENDIKTYAVAKAVGYNNVRHFTDKFKELYGESPNAYKKNRKSQDTF